MECFILANKETMDIVEIIFKSKATTTSGYV